MSAGVYDAAVIGGGPAGCSAAIALAWMGCSVVVCEAQTYPHEKVCGEFLSPECRSMLEALGLNQRLGAVPITTARLSAPDGTLWETRLPGTGWGISRGTLDAALAEQALVSGAELRAGTAVTAVTGSLDAFELTLRDTRGVGSLRTRAVIAADGKRGALDRALRRSFLGRRQPYLALKAHFRGPPLPGSVHLNAFTGGYCGYCAIEGGLFDVCLLVHEDVFRQAAGSGRDRLETFIAWMQRQNPHIEAWLGQAERVDERWLSIAQVPFLPKEPVIADMLLAGDAAGLIVPLAGDGIAMALSSGLLAAAHIHAYLGGDLPARAVPAAYSAAWRRRFATRMRLAQALQTLWLQPRLTGPGLRLLNLAPPLARTLIACTRDAPFARHTRAGRAADLPDQDITGSSNT